MRTVTKTIYKYDELPTEKAKERARDWFRGVDVEYNWYEESRESMEGFTKHFPVRVKDWSYGGQGSGVTFEFTGEDGLENIAGVRLYKWLSNNGIGKLTGGDCPFTGYCMDEVLLDPIRAFLKQPINRVTFRELLEDCYHAWVKGCENDIEYQGSDENVAETILANEYEFDEDGGRAR